MLLRLEGKYYLYRAQVLDVIESASIALLVVLKLSGRW